MKFTIFVGYKTLPIVIFYLSLIFSINYYNITDIISDKIPDDNNFNNGSQDRQVWEANDTEETSRNDTGMYTHNNGHVKFSTPRVPVIFVLGNEMHL